jgi:HEAT repeat protein
MRTFLYFKDPRADRYLLRELDSNDPGVLLSVIRLASNSRDPEVARKLSEILNRKPLKETGEIVKRAVLKSLAEIALPEALPGLKRFLFSRRRLFQSMQEQSLKLEAVRTLARFSDPGAAALAELVYQKFSGELARVAGQVCLQLKGKLPWI